MRLKIGIDVGGTFTDFFVTGPGVEPGVFKVLSTPPDPSVGLLNGLQEIAASLDISINELGRSIDTIVHGTTVTTNAVLTLSGARTGLLTTEGVRDALEMRRGIREEQYNNRYTNVPPLVERYLRIPIRGRTDYRGDEIVPLSLDDVRDALELFERESVDAIAICFMNSFVNPEHEVETARLVREAMPKAFLTVSSEFLPSIRFYDRLSSTVLNSYVGPKLRLYLARLQSRLKEISFEGVLLFMQSNGGVMSPDVAQKDPARTVLSGPAAGPGAGYGYVRPYGFESCITIDMGGTSFDAALVSEGSAVVVTEGEINRYRIALPMLDIVTIGAGGGSIAWIDEGGLLRMGPQSAGADPGPACYGKGGSLPTCTDADLTLGYLDPAYFAGGRIKLNSEAAAAAIREHVAKPLDVSLERAAAGMYQVINTNMAQGVREASIKRGFDPREFPIVVAGGAGPLHACMICRELSIPLFIVPNESSIFCAAGMLISDLQHDLVHSFVSTLNRVNWKDLCSQLDAMEQEGNALLRNEDIPPDARRFIIHLDCRYARQYHEVSFRVAKEAIQGADVESISRAFHAEHRRMYGYSLEAHDVLIELINIRLRAIGVTAKPKYVQQPGRENQAERAQKGERKIYQPEKGKVDTVAVYNGHKTGRGCLIRGPAIIEQVNTTLLVTSSYDCSSDRFGSFLVFQRDQLDRIPSSVRGTLP